MPNTSKLCNLYSFKIREIKAFGEYTKEETKHKCGGCDSVGHNFDNVTHLMSHIRRAVIAPNSSTLLMRMKTFRQTQRSFAHYTDLSEMTTWPSLVIPC